MLCALTVRKLRPGTLEDFKKAFIPADAPRGWTRFYALRNVDDEDEVITFGFFDGTPKNCARATSRTPATTNTAGDRPTSLSSPLAPTAFTRCSRSAHSA